MTVGLPQVIRRQITLSVFPTKLPEPGAKEVHNKFVLRK
jgi:hypothetical protein